MFTGYFEQKGVDNSERFLSVSGEESENEKLLAVDNFDHISDKKPLLQASEQAFLSQKPATNQPEQD